MPLTLKEAAMLAQLSPEDLVTEINKGSLVAAQAVDQAEEDYIIEEFDLDAFLKKKSFDALWSESDSDEEDLEPTPRSPSMAGNLRRVLTAEAVSELKIQHQVLISRVQTLERLFSEFMDAEKDAENTLVLEDDWKITEAAGKAEVSKPVQVSHEDLAEVATHYRKSSETATSEIDHEIQSLVAESEQQADMPEVEQEVASEAAPLQSNHEARRAYQLQTAEEARNSGKKTSDTARPEDDEELEARSEGAKAKSGKGLLAMKLKLMETDKTALDAEAAGHNIDAVEEAQENLQDNNQDDEEDGGGTGIAERLQEYERRLAHAKQTATQMWH
jgi:hypothetical protein